MVRAQGADCSVGRARAVEPVLGTNTQVSGSDCLLRTAPGKYKVGCSTEQTWRDITKRDRTRVQYWITFMFRNERGRV